MMLYQTPYGLFLETTVRHGSINKKEALIDLRKILKLLSNRQVRKEGYAERRNYSRCKRKNGFYIYAERSKSACRGNAKILQKDNRIDVIAIKNRKNSNSYIRNA